MFQLTQVSQQRLEGVDPRLVRVVMGALAHLPEGLTVIEGLRTKARQHELYGHGRTARECYAAGIDPKLARPTLAKVTWTLNSRHFANPRTGLSEAVDLAPYPLDWNDLKKFDAIARAMFASANELGIPIRWGADWDRDGKPRERGETDSPHFELASKQGAA